MNKNRGFTLIEMMVSVALFTLVMVVALGALLGLSEANRKADSISAAVNNLGAALDDVSRAARTGINYHCDITTGALANPQNCTASPGASSFAFLASDGATEVAYRLDPTTSGTNVCGQTAAPYGCIERSLDSGHTWLPMTSADVIVTKLTFYVEGAALGDGVQPRVLILMSGYVSVTAIEQSAFNIETSVTQRLYDE